MLKLRLLRDADNYITCSRYFLITPKDKFQNCSYERPSYYTPCLQACKIESFILSKNRSSRQAPNAKIRQRSFQNLGARCPQAVERPTAAISFEICF